MKRSVTFKSFSLYQTTNCVKSSSIKHTRSSQRCSKKSSQKSSTKPCWPANLCCLVHKHTWTRSTLGVSRASRPLGHPYARLNASSSPNSAWRHTSSVCRNFRVSRKVWKHYKQRTRHYSQSWLTISNRKQLAMTQPTGAWSLKLKQLSFSKDCARAKFKKWKGRSAKS